MHCLRSAEAFLRSRSVLLAAVIASVSSIALSQDSFMLHFTPSGAGAGVVNRGDFNNDGIPDIITGNNGGTGGFGVSVNLGIGDGRFHNPLNSGQGVGTFDMAVGDFNGDGKLDVALAGHVSSTQEVVQIELGKGDGTFTTGQTINLASILNASGITTGDFDGDGKLDLAVISNTANQVYFYKGSGTGTFTSAASVTVGTSPWTLTGVRTGDFNADGKVDLVVSNYKGLFVLWNNGGNFSFTRAKVGSSNYGIGATPVDINQDGFTDLLVVYYTCEVGKDIAGGNCTNWKVLLGSANRTFKQTWNVNLPYTFQGLWGTTAADINGDGINDIVGIAGFYQMYVWLGNPDGTYRTTPLSFQIGSNSSASDLVASDFNRDGKIDFAIPTAGSSSSTGLAVLLNATPRATCTPSTVSPSVTVCQPQDLTFLNSPVHWIADSRDTSHPVNAMQIYVDSKLVVNSPSSSLNEFVSLSKGPHSVVTKAWDSSGANFRSNRRITIYSGTPGETCAAAPSSINVCLPTQNEVTTTSLHLFANADSVAQITAVQVYLDGKLIYNDTSGATYVDTAFIIATGSHSVVVKAWDADGSVFTQSRNVTAQ
jgi:FG-GAP-like repeat